MISPSNPIHRLREVQTQLRDIHANLQPYYDASRLVNGEADCEALEHNPAFRAEWLKQEPLHAERDRLYIALALAWERCPIAL